MYNGKTGSDTAYVPVILLIGLYVEIMIVYTVPEIEVMITSVTMKQEIELNQDEEPERCRRSTQSTTLPKLETPKAVLFDWDNTLVDTWNTIFYAVNDTLIAFGLEPWTEEFALSNIQRSGRETFPKLFGDKAKEAQKYFYKLVEEDNLQGLRPMSEAQSLLEVLLKMEIPTGVVSNKNGRYLRREVSHLGWDKYFQVLVGAGDASRDKPAADPIMLALETLNVPISKEVWMIGDAPVDWDCAYAAGCQAIAIGDRFEKSPSVLISIDNCGDLKKIFAKM